MQLSAIVSVQSSPVVDLSDLLMVAEQVASAEGKNLYMHTAKMGVAAGDLAACLTESKDGFPRQEEIYDEVAALVVRATIFGVAHGMNGDQLRAAIERESSRLVGAAMSERVEGAIKDAGLVVAGSALPIH